MSRQLTLNLRLRDASSFANFYPGPNREAMERLRGALVQTVTSGRAPEPGLYLWGAGGTGKTHLLQAACRLAQELGATPAYLPLTEVMTLTPGVLEGTERAPLVCLDDIERIAGRAEWEDALFILVERLRGVGGLWVAAASAPIAEIGLRLPDLASRLAGSAPYHLHALSDAEKLAAVRQRADGRGFEVSEEVAKYILSRFPRDTHSLFGLLDRIDEASLMQRRRVTIPFLRRLEELGREDVEAG